ncbi:hypothetical protein, partial [Enterococcus faecium]
FGVVSYAENTAHSAVTASGDCQSIAGDPSDPDYLDIVPVSELLQNYVKMVTSRQSRKAARIANYN